MTDLHGLSLSQAALEIREGRITATELVNACLARIASLEPTVHAWAFLDREHVLRQAQAADADRAAGKPIGPLHGVPVGIKDVFDTSDYPTELGSPLYAGRTPRRDATCVARLRAAGAIVMGKTATTEFAYFQPAATTNPHDPTRTPGGSSSGSAAAVAAMMVPGAIGTQTNGSVIRPAAFCGVVGFKPTYGLIPRTGVLELSQSLDQIGVFARTIADAALLAEVMAGHDAGDAATRPIATPPLARTAAEAPPLPPRFAFMKTAVWDKAEAATRDAFAELAATIGDRAIAVELPSIGAHAVDLHRTVMDVEMARSLHREYEDAPDQLSELLRRLIERGRKYLAVDYRRALDLAGRIYDAVDAIFDEFDAIVTPAAPGEAPMGLNSTGDPAFCTLWTYIGAPAVTLPLLQGLHDLPMGVQLIGRRGNDGRLLRTARWLADSLGSPNRKGRVSSKKRKRGST